MKMPSDKLDIFSVSYCYILTGYALVTTTAAGLELHQSCSRLNNILLRIDEGIMT